MMTSEEIAVEIYKLYIKRCREQGEAMQDDLFQLCSRVMNGMSADNKKNFDALIARWRDEEAAIKAAESERMWQEAIDQLHVKRDMASFNQAVLALELLFHDFENLTLKQACLAADEIQVAF